MEQATLESKLSGIVGLPLWGLKRGVGTFLTFEVGRLDVERSSSGVNHGEWHFWIRMAFWRIGVGPQIIASSMDDDGEDSVLGGDSLDGRTPIIERITRGRQFNDFSIVCSEQLVLDICIATSRADDEQWAIYLPDRQVISAYGDGRIVIGT
jgi:hypothetical protein